MNLGILQPPPCEPTARITGRELDIPNFSSHLKQFSEEIRGGFWSA